MLSLRRLKPYLWLPIFGLAFLLIAWKLRPNIELQYYIQPLTITINIVLISIFIFLARKELQALLRSVPGKFWIAITLIFIFGLSLRLFVPPMEHKIYFDEDIYLNIAHNIANQGRACLCDYGTYDDCYLCIDNKQPMGMQTFYGILMRLFSWAGFGSERSIFVASIFMSSLAIFLLFIMVFQLTGNSYAGLVAAVFLAINPTHIRWSVSISQDAYFLTFLLLTVIIFLIQRRDWHLELLGYLVAAYTAQIRTEGLILVPIVVAFLFATRKKLFGLLKKRETIIGVALLLLLVMPTIIHSLSNKEDSWGAPDGKKLSIDYFPKNASENIRFLFDKSKFPVLVTLFALAGLCYGLFKHTKAALALLVWFILFFLLYAFFYAGSFDYGMDVRFLLTMLAPLLIFSGLGLCFIFDLPWKLNKLKKLKRAKEFVFILLICLVAGVVLVSHWSEIALFGEEASDALKSHAMAREFSAKTPDSCIFISQVSSMFNNFGRTSIQTHRFLWSGFEEKIVQGYNCIYLDWGYWCASAEAFRNEQCDPILKKYNWVKEGSIMHYEREFAMYRMVK